MSRTYKATGINLQGMPLGEADRLLSVLTREHGLIRVVAPGARKHKSKIGGRSGLFVVNELLISKGRSLDKITQAETLTSYPGLSQDLGKLTASQYIAELALYQALGDQPQEELFCLLNEHLSRLEHLPSMPGNPSSALVILAHLTHAIFHLLALAGIAPQVQACCITQHSITPNFNDPHWRVGFSTVAGGTVSLQALENGHVNQPSLQHQLINPVRNFISTPSPSPRSQGSHSTPHHSSRVAELASPYPATRNTRRPNDWNSRLNATEVGILQQLAQPELADSDFSAVLDQGSHLEASHNAWLSVERTLRQYVQYHFDRPIRSAALIDTCFSMPTAPSSPKP